MPIPTAPLLDVNMNIHRRALDSPLKYPPGLGFGSAPNTKHHQQQRRRSGSFGPIISGSTPTPRPSLGKRSASAAGLFQQYRAFDREEIPPPPPSPSNINFAEFSAPQPPRVCRFDPFAADDVAFPSASSTSYSHYWEYDPETRGPRLVTSAPRPFNVHVPVPVVKLAPATSHSFPSAPPPPLHRVQTRTQTPVPSILPPLHLPDKTALSKLVAKILLNRIHAVGKPMRGRQRLESTDAAETKAYVKSGLSRMVSLHI